MSKIRAKVIDQYVSTAEMSSQHMQLPEAMDPIANWSALYNNRVTEYFNEGNELTQEIQADNRW